MSTFKNLWDRLGDWLLLHWLTVLALALAFAFFMVLLAGKKSQDAGAAVEHGAVLSKKQVKRAEKVIAQKLDSIRVQTGTIEKIKLVRDSALVVARRAEVKADSSLKVLKNEKLTEADLTPTGVYNRLADYRPGAVVLAPGDTLY